MISIVNLNQMSRLTDKGRLGVKRSKSIVELGIVSLTCRARIQSHLTMQTTFRVSHDTLLRERP